MLDKPVETGGKKIFETPLYPYRQSPDQKPDAKVHHPVVIIGAGPIGLAAAIDLAQMDIPVVVLDENDKVSWGSRAICFAKRPLEILDRLNWLGRRHGVGRMDRVDDIVTGSVGHFARPAYKRMNKNERE